MNYRRLITLVTMLFLVGALASAQQHGMKHAAKADSTSVASAVYTCPMHPKVTSSKPGECPECGMALVMQKDKSAKHKAGRAMKKSDKSKCADCTDCADCAKDGEKADAHSKSAAPDSSKHH
jgi:uncharacterized protein with PIN domain